MQIESAIAPLVPDALDCELDFPLHIRRHVYPADCIAKVGSQRHDLRLQRHPPFDGQFNFNRDATADRFLMEALDEGTTCAEVVNPYRNRQKRAAAAHERTEYSLVQTLVVRIG